MFLDELRKGVKVAAAADAAQRSVKSVENWRATDGEFRAEYDRIRGRQRVAKSGGGARSRRKPLPYKVFAEKYLQLWVPPHLQNVVDVIEGRAPSWLHDTFVFERNRPNMILVNMPPEHAKTMGVTIGYTTKRIAEDPSFRGIVVSKTKDQAKEFLYAIGQRLTHPKYEGLIAEFGGIEGFKTKDATWQSDKIYLGAELRDPDEKDPTLEALGIGGQIYGARADLIILDDCVTLSNAHEFEKQIRWIQQEVLTRLGPGGTLLILGTRVDNIDLYSEIVDGERYPAGSNPWTLLRMPAVLEFADDPDDWVTLWPRSDRPWDGVDGQEPDDDGLYPHWDGRHLYQRRAVLDPKTWAMVYQQQEVDADAVFDAKLVRAAVNGMRKTGPLLAGTPGHPARGGEGMQVICSMDPAIVGDTGAVAVAVDRHTKKRFVLDAACITSPTPAKIKNLILEWTEKYRPIEWRIEKNAFQGFLTQDEDLRQQLASRGVMLREHFTGSNKWDVNFGVASMAPLFGYPGVDDYGRWRADNQLIEFSSTSNSEGMKALLEQLVTWAPDTKNKTDMVMALWFAEIRARELLGVGQGNTMTHLHNEFLTEDRKERRVVVSLEEAVQARQSYMIA